MNRLFSLPIFFFLMLCLTAFVLFPANGTASGTDAAPEASSAESGLDDALDFLRQRATSLVTLSCAFTQESNIPLFTHPIMSKGLLLFKRPNKLIWQYVEPVQEAFVLNGGLGFRWEDSKENRIPFSTAKDPVAAFVGNQLLSWIRIDLNMIRAQYHVEAISYTPLTLLLTPLKNETWSVIRSIQIVFDGQGTAQTVTLSEARGGTTLIRFSHIKVNGSLGDEVFE